MTLVLVAYATKHGSTAEVAEAIAAELEERGLEVELAPAREVNELDGYSAVVLGGAIYMGRWHHDARAFLGRHRRALADLPVAIFGMGPLTTEEEDVRGSRRQLEHALSKVRGLLPATVAVFGGVVDPAKLRFPFTHIPASDARDWDAIRAWADEVADLVGGASPEGSRAGTGRG
jgi:menaquinone-dependent protoporphyrinogen oxidase